MKRLLVLLVIVGIVLTGFACSAPAENGNGTDPPPVNGNGDDPPPPPSPPPPPPPEDTFEIIGWTVVKWDDAGTVQFKVEYSTTESIWMDLLDPNGDKVGYDYVSNEAQTVSELDMSDYRETPLPGTYTLVVKASDVIISETTYTFTGANVVISDLVLDWEYDDYFEEYTLTEIEITVGNTGDLPASIDDGSYSVGDEDGWLYFGEILMPGQEIVLVENRYDYGIPPGALTFSIDLRDESGDIQATRTETVTPA